MFKDTHIHGKEPADREIGLEGGVASVGDVEGRRAPQGTAA